MGLPLLNVLISTCVPLLCCRFPSSQCSVSSLRWRVLWSLSWWRTGELLQTLFSSTAGWQLSLHCYIFSFNCNCFNCNVEYKMYFWVQTALKDSCVYLQHFWFGPRQCHQPVHHHLTAAPRGRGRCWWPRCRTGGGAASVSCRCPGASPTDNPDVTQHQQADWKSLCCPFQGLSIPLILFFPKHNLIWLFTKCLSHTAQPLQLWEDWSSAEDHTGCRWQCHQLFSKSGKKKNIFLHSVVHCCYYSTEL